MNGRYVANDINYDNFLYSLQSIFILSAPSSWSDLVY